ncbi:hypothetical protein D3C76_1295730 [compost metagenome]
MVWLPMVRESWPSCCTSLLARMFISGEPIKPATNMFFGLWYRLSGVSTCMMWPSFITQMRSPMVIASVWSCVT